MMRRRAIGLVVLLLAASACTTASTPVVSIEQARASLCAHVITVTAAIIGQPSPESDVRRLLEADAILYDQAGSVEIADEIGALAERLETTGPALRAYLFPGMPEELVTEVRSRLEEVDGVVSVRYESQEQAYERFLELFAGQEDVIENADPASIPASFEAMFEDGTDLTEVATELEAIDGVRQVSTSGPRADRATADAVRSLFERECPDTLARLEGFPLG